LLNNPCHKRFFSANWEVESKVNNGGFSQYFRNDSAESASFVVEALEIIGAPKNREYLPSRDSHCISWRFTSNGRDYHDLPGLLFTYVNAHPEEFGKLPKPLLHGAPVLRLG